MIWQEGRDWELERYLDSLLEKIREEKDKILNSRELCREETDESVKNETEKLDEDVCRDEQETSADTANIDRESVRIKERICTAEGEFQARLKDMTAQVERISTQKAELEKEKDTAEKEFHAKLKDMTVLVEQIAARKADLENEIIESNREKEGLRRSLIEGTRMLAKKIEEEGLQWRKKTIELEKEKEVIRNELEVRDSQLKFINEYYSIGRKNDLCRVRLADELKRTKIDKNIKAVLNEMICGLSDGIEDERKKIKETFDKLHEENISLREGAVRSESSVQKDVSVRNVIDIKNEELPDLLYGKSVSSTDIEKRISEIMGRMEAEVENRIRDKEQKWTSERKQLTDEIEALKKYVSGDKQQIDKIFEEQRRSFRKEIKRDEEDD